MLRCFAMDPAREVKEDYHSHEIRLMIQNAISSGIGLDNCDLKDGNSLLHQSVKQDLQDCIVKLLSAGANPNITNARNETPYDIALETGNQIAMQLLTRREEYYRQVFQDPDCWQVSLDGTSAVFLQVIYEDYLDWSSSTQINHLYKLVDQAKNDESKLQQKLRDLLARKSKSGENLQKLQELLKKKEIKQQLKRWETQDVVTQNAHAVDVISEDLDHTKKVLEKIRSMIYWRGYVDIRRYKGIIFQRWREASLIVTGCELVIDYSTDHEDRLSSDDANIPSPPASLLSTASPLSLSVKSGSQRTLLLAHRNDNSQHQSLSWTGPIRRQLRLISSNRSRRIVSVPLHRVRSVHLNKVIGENGLENEITIAYFDDTHTNSKSASLPSTTLGTTTSTTAASVILNNATSTAGSLPTGTSLSMCSTVRSQSMLSGISCSFGWQANDDDREAGSVLDDRDSFCPPDVSGKLRTVYLRQLNTGGSGGSRGHGGTPTVSTSPVDYFPYVVQKLNTNVKVFCTLNGSPTHFQDPTDELLDLDELFAEDTDEEDDGHTENRKLLTNSHHKLCATIDDVTGHYFSCAHPDEEEKEHSPSSPVHDQDDMNLEENANGFGHSLADGSTGYSSNLSNLFRAVSGRSSMSSSIGHHSSGATSVESDSTLASTMQQHARRIASQLTGIEEEDDSHNNSFTSASSRLSSLASSGSNSIITSSVAVGKESIQISSHFLDGAVGVSATDCSPSLALVGESSLSSNEDFQRTVANPSKSITSPLTPVPSNSTDRLLSNQARNRAGDMHARVEVAVSPRAAAFLNESSSVIPAGGAAVSLDSHWGTNSGENFSTSQTWRSDVSASADSLGASSTNTGATAILNTPAKIVTPSSQSIKSFPQRSRSLSQSPPTQTQPQQFSNHSRSSLPSPYRLRGRRVKLRECKHRAVAIDGYRTYRSPYLHDSMAAQIDFVPVLRFLLEHTKMIRDGMKEKLHVSIMRREELREEYEYLFSLRTLAGNPPRAPSSIFSISAEQGTSILERVAILQNLYTDHIDEASQFRDLSVDSNTPIAKCSYHNIRNSPVRRLSTAGTTNAIQSPSSCSYSYNGLTSSQRLVSGYSLHHQCVLTAMLSAIASSPPLGGFANCHSNSGSSIHCSTGHAQMAVSTESLANVLEARDLLRWLTQSEQGPGEMIHALHQQVHPQSFSSSNRSQSVSSLSASRSTSSIAMRQVPSPVVSPPKQSAAAITTPMLHGIGGSASNGSGAARVSPWRSSLHRAMILPVDLHSMRMRLQYEEEDGEQAFPDPLPNPAHSRSEAALVSAPEHWTQENLSLAEREEDANQENLLNHSSKIRDIQSWRSKLGPPPPAYRRYSEKVLSNVERIWDCELESYETFKKLAASILHREETLRRIASLRGKQQDKVASSHRKTVVAPPQEELFDVEI
jgi:hypothetical protein